jgi:hypothetical protein
MADTRLYAVDSLGEATPPPPPTGPQDQPRVRAASKARPRYPVPTDRLKFELQEKALRVVCMASRNGTEPVDAAKMASLMGVSTSTAPLSNAFFVSVGLMERVGKGDYLPSKLALEYQRKYSFDQTAAKAILAPAFANTWFYDAVRQRAALGSTSRDQMIETLAAEAQTDDSYKVQYGLLLDWLQYVGLVDLTGGVVKLRGDVDTPPSPPAEQNVSPPEPKPSSPVDQEQPADKPKVTEGRSSSILSLSFTVDVTADDLAKLTGEQIAALFDGVGKVAAIKATLTSPA